MSDTGSLVLPARPVLPRTVVGGDRDRDREPVDSAWNRFVPRLGILATPWRSRRARARARAITAFAKTLTDLDEAAFDARRLRAAATLRREGLQGAAVVEGLAVAAEVARRVLGMMPFPGQLAAASSLARGEVVEMDTGEGKTLSSFLAAAVCAMAGRVVHVVTANDYLAERDSEILSPALRRLGISTGVVIAGQEPDERRAAYAADVTFLAGKEAAFDHLRDGLVRGHDPRDQDLDRKLGRVFGDHGSDRTLQRALDIALIDEVDSVLVDEGGTPLIISAAESEAIDPTDVAAALDLGAELEEGVHYRLVPRGIMPDLTAEGAAVVESRVSGRPGPWRIRLRREEMIRAALAARHSLQRDRDYILREDKVVIVDPHTGRTMPDRQWGHDLHAMVEGKEGLVPTGRRKALASTSFQRFFRKYRHLAGMSGTVREVASELATIYGLQLTRVPRRLPLRRRWVGRTITDSRDALWDRIGEDVLRRHRKGQPVMVAVGSVAESEHAVAELKRRGIPHRLLSAAQDKGEAEIVAEAGQRGAVTVVTNMAGRGTDIRLGPGVAELDGLAVLVCERHESRRVDRQLMGRAARQGDPGEVAEFLSAEDEMLVGAAPWNRFIGTPLGRRLFGPLAFRTAQMRIERVQARRRFELVRRDEQLARMLAFAGGLD